MVALCKGATFKELWEFLFMLSKQALYVPCEHDFMAFLFTGDSGGC